MADKHKVYEVLKRGYFSGPEDSIHLVIFSRKFAGRGLKDKHDLIWSELLQRLAADEWGKVSLSIGTGPEDIKAA